MTFVSLLAFIKEGNLLKPDVLVDKRLEGESLRISPPNRFILVGVVSPHPNQTLSMTADLSSNGSVSLYLWSLST